MFYRGRTARRLSAIALMSACATAGWSAVAVGATVYEDVPLTASDFNSSGYALDTVSGNPFTGKNNGNGVPTASQGTGPDLGGPSTTSSYFSNGEGYYGTPADVAPPTNNFDLSIYAEASNTTQSTDLFASNTNNPGSLQIGLIGGDYVAYLDTAGNDSGTPIGSVLATTDATHLEITDIAGTLEFLVDGVPVGTESASGFSGWGVEHLGVTPGGNSTFTGYLADLTITSVPEPSTLAGIFAAGALALTRRRRRSSRA